MSVVSTALMPRWVHDGCIGHMMVMYVRFVIRCK